jgi:hypothetical protein
MRYYVGQSETPTSRCSSVQPAPVEIKHRSGGERPHSASDARQMGTALPGGCHKGELTILGKMQVYACIPNQYSHTHTHNLSSGRVRTRSIKPVEIKTLLHVHQRT